MYQLLIVNQCGELLTCIIIDGDNWWGLHIREGIDVILHGVAENSTIGTFFSRQLGLSAFSIYLINGAAEGTTFITLIIESIGFFVPTQEVLHFIFPLSNLFHQVSAGGIQIQMVIAVSFTHHNNVIGIETDVGISRFLDVLVGFITDNQFA